MHRIFLCVIALLCQIIHADVQSLKQKITSNYPKLSFKDIENTPIEHLYSAKLDNQKVYLDESGEYLLTGTLFRLKDQKNLTEASEQNKPSLWSALPLQDAVRIVKGSGQHKIAVFSDPHCPYCQQLELEINRLNDVTIYVFLYPLRPESIKLTQQVWCSPNASYAWQRLMQQGINPTASSRCSNPVQNNLELGKKLGFSGTPVIIFANGQYNIGLLSSTQIQSVWSEHGL